MRIFRLGSIGFHSEKPTGTVFERGALLSAFFPQTALWPSTVAPFSYVPKPQSKTPALSQTHPTPALRRGLFCPLELSLCEENKNTAPCEFMFPPRVAIQNMNFSEFRSENQSKKNRATAAFIASNRKPGLYGHCAHTSYEGFSHSYTSTHT